MSPLAPCVVGHHRILLLFLSSFTTSAAMLVSLMSLSLVQLPCGWMSGTYPAVTHCIPEAHLLNQTNPCDPSAMIHDTLKGGLFSGRPPIYICDFEDGYGCLPSIRYCAEGESPLDMLHKKITPGLVIGLGVGLAACCFLQWLTNYYNMFRVFGTVHRSLIFDLATANDVKRLSAVLVRKRGDLKDMLSRSNSSGETPLHIACRLGHYKVVDMLLCRGAKSLKVNSQGKTALHVAVANQDEATVNAFAKSASDEALRAKDASGQTALEMALEMGLSKIAALVASGGVEDLNEGTNMAHLACMNSDPFILDGVAA